MDVWNEFHGPNAGYLIELLERYRQDRGSIDEETRTYFDRLTPTQIDDLLSGRPVGAAPTLPVETSTLAVPGVSAEKIAGAINLAQSIRWYGHFAAQLDPLGTPPIGDPALRLETYGLTEDDLRQIPANLIGGIAGERTVRQGGTALDAIQYLRSVYSGNIGFDYLQIRDPVERTWLREAAESGRFSPQGEQLDAVGMLNRLTQVEAFEHFLQRSFVAKTRFSIEGLDMLVPMFDTVIWRAAESGIYNILIGMAHRGRLNVLAHILNKPVEQILAEFKDPLQPRLSPNEDLGFTGDVKYHAGAQTVIDEDNDPETINMTVAMAPNPSHLEAVNPVVEGMARASGTDASQPGPSQFEPSITLPVLIHGDSAFPGQGVVAETLNMYRLNGYSTGGTIHIIANNQIGFTANPNESRSTLFASDLAKGFRMPIIHVNADDPEACITAARTAFAYRAHFHRDFVIDLIGYRRRGHNEGDEASFTQPVLYQKIEAHPSVRKLWAERLVNSGVVAADFPEQCYQEEMARLQQALEQLDPERLEEQVPVAAPPGAARSVRTAVPAETLKRLSGELLRVPEGFAVHPRLARIRQRRERLFVSDDGQEQPPIDWSTAEELALATILEDGIPIRMTGQDVERGTFSHRHAVLFDINTNKRYIPYHGLSQARASFDIINSPLSEYAALGFEFGYNVQSPGTLVIWEAQYGDFINNAQTIIDEFVVSARDKWGQLTSLVILLPHGYEGQGPDHSSGRLERFTNLSADYNMRVANCTTAANYYHLLRRQALLLDVDPLPLFVMTPKSLLRHPLVASPISDFTEGGWQPVIDRQRLPETNGDHSHLPPADEVRRILLCSGKVYVDLVTNERAGNHPEVGIVRVEQLAPFPIQDLTEVLARYPALDEIIWVQEEPENMGTYAYARPFLRAVLAELQSQRELPISLYYLARPRSSSPAEGSSSLHAYNQQKLIESAFERKFERYEEGKRRKIWASPE